MCFTHCGDAVYMQLSSKHALLSLLVDPDPSPFMSTKSPSGTTFLTVVQQIKSIRPHSVLTFFTTLVCLAVARIAYRYTRRRWRSRHAPLTHLLALRKRRRPSLSEITVVNVPTTTSLAAPLQKALRVACKYIKLIVWDSALYPLLAWFFNTLAILFALIISVLPTLLWVQRKRMKVCVATSSSSSSNSLPATDDSQSHQIQQAEATQLNKGKSNSSLSRYFSGLMVPAALSCTQSRKSLVLDLDETLVHSQFKLTEHCDLRLEVRVDEFPAVFYVSKRPYLDFFLRTVAQWYDIVIFTASLQKYGDPLITVLDTDRVVKRRIFRQDCIKRNGNFAKDLTIVNPNLADVLIVDNSPAAYSIQPSNAVPIETWYNDQNDEELLNLLPLLHAIAFLNDVRSLLDLRLTGGALAGRKGRPVSR